MEKKVTTEEFVLLAFKTLDLKGKGVLHTVYSGFNEGFRDYYPGQDPIAAIKQLHEQGKISFRLCRGGALIALPGVITPVQTGKATLAKMGLK